MRSVPCVLSWCSLDHLLFYDGYLICPLAFRHKKGEYFCRVFVFKGSFYLFWLELVEFRLYLGALLCTLLS